MADKPIPFSGPMVGALLAGRKTQTRRVLRPQFPEWVKEAGFSCFTPEGHVSGRGTYVDDQGVNHGPAEKFVRLPYAAGDRLWVKEELRGDGQPGNRRVGIVRYGYDGEMVLAGGSDHLWSWKRPKLAARYCPRWASRLTLTVTEVRVQRLQEISNSDARSEGVKWSDWPGCKSCACDDEDCVWCSHYPALYTPAFKHLWASLHGPGAWDANPWVCAVTFTVAHRNIDPDE